MPLAAQEVAVYRCVDSTGRIALQDRPCPPGQLDRQRSVRLDQPTVTPPPVTPPPAPEPPREEPGAPPSRDPPPPLWRCVDYEGRTRLSPRDDPNPRYVPYWVVFETSGGDALIRQRSLGAGLAGGADPGTAPAGGPVPMVRVEDRCQPLPPGEACRAYRSQRDEAARVAHSRMGAEREALLAEVERLRDLLTRHCD